MHNFGGQAPRLPKQEKGWLERFHAWKHRIWAWFRDFIRAQFSPDSRHEIRLWRAGETAPPKKGPQATEYAQVPVLNQQQLVSEWKWAVPKGERWQSQQVTIPVRDKGVYLVEATNGTLRAYTIVVVTDIAIITKAAPGRLLYYVVDRTTGDPNRRSGNACVDRAAGRSPTRQPTSREWLTSQSRRPSRRTSLFSPATRTRLPSTLPARGTWGQSRRGCAATPTRTVRCIGRATRCTSRPSFATKRPRDT